MLDDIALIGRGRIDLENMHSVDAGGLADALDHFRQRLFEIGGAQKFLRAHRYRFEDGVPPMRCEDRERIIELARLLDRFRPRLQLALLNHEPPEGGRKRGSEKSRIQRLQYCQKNIALPLRQPPKLSPMNYRGANYGHPWPESDTLVCGRY